MVPTTNPPTESHDETKLTDSIRRATTSTTFQGLLALLVVSGLAGTGMAMEIPHSHGATTSQGTDVVNVTCSGFQVDVPADTEYLLHITIRDENSGDQFRALAGPFMGPLDEQMDDSSFTITAVEVQYVDGGSASASLTDQC